MQENSKNFQFKVKCLMFKDKKRHPKVSLVSPERLELSTH